MPDDRLPKILLQWKPSHGKRSRGRPKKSWINCVREDAALFSGHDSITVDDMIDMADDRVKWRTMIKSRNFLGAGHSND